MPSLPLPVETYTLRSRQASTSRLVNCFAEKLPDGAKSPVMLTRAPGIASFATVGSGPIQAMHAAHGLLYVVSSGGLYSVTSAGVATFRGGVGPGDNVDIDSNDTSVVVVNATTGLGYYWTSPTFAQITDADFTTLGAADVEFVDNYLLFRDTDSGVFFGADLGSPSSFDALNFATAEGHPDDLVGMKVDHRQVLLFGEQTIEIWQNTGISGFPFERTSPGVIELGCANGRTIEKADNSVLWVANDLTVRRLDGLTPIRVSTHSIEHWLTTVTLSAGRSWSYTQDGHIFYGLTFPEGTRVFDLTTGLWHSRETYGDTTWRWGNVVRAFNKVLVGATNSNVVGELSPTTYDENGLTQVMEWTYQPVFAEGARAFHDRLEMDFDSGVGLTTGQGSDPEVMLDISDDGGVTWRSLPNKKLGQLGEYRKRVTWHALGSSRERVYRGRVSDPVRVSLTNTMLEARGGRL